MVQETSSPMSKANVCVPIHHQILLPYKDVWLNCRRVNMSDLTLVTMSLKLLFAIFF